MVCQKCGAQNDEMQKFCGKCGAKTEASIEQNLEGQAQENLGHVPEQFPNHMPTDAPGHAPEHLPEQGEPNKKPLGLIVGVVVALIAIVVGVILFSGTNVADEMRSQLEELDQTSYSDIKEWIDNDFTQYFEEHFDLAIEAIDDTRDVLGNTFLDEEDRFIEWSFTIDTEDDKLFIELVYEKLNLREVLESEVEELDRSSLGDILDWMDRVEGEHGREVFILTHVFNADGDWLDSNVANMENEDLFVEWTVDIAGDVLFMNITVEMVFNTIRTFNFGDTFEADGLEVAIEGDIRWGIVDNEFATDFGVEYFKVPVTLTNISNTTINRFSPGLYAPDGTQISSLFIFDNDDDITRMGGLRPDATQSGYIFIRFLGDGDYVIEVRDWPLMVEVIVPMNSSDFQRERDELLAALEPDEEDDVVGEEALIGRWVDGFGDSLQVFGEAETIEFRADGTVLIIEGGVERTTTWESSDWDEYGFGTLDVDGMEFMVLADFDWLGIMDEEGNVKSWWRD